MEPVLLEDDFDQENGGIASSETFAYTAWANWDVVDGSVDLIGNGSNDLQPGNGLYVDLDGWVSGTLASKSMFALDPGEYELEFDLAGSHRGDVNAVTVTLGGAYDEQFTLDSEEPFRRITRTIRVDAPTNARLVFDHAGGGDTLGLLLDNVRLAGTALGVASVSPASGGNAGTVSVVVRGAGFEQGARVRLMDGGHPVLEGQATVVASRGRIETTFDLRGQEPRAVELEVRNPDGQSSVAPAPFVIESGGRPELWVDISGRPAILLGRESVYTISYGNTGTVDAYVPALTVAVPNTAGGVVRSLAPPPPGVDPQVMPEYIRVGDERWFMLLIPRVAAGDTQRLLLTIRPSEIAAIALRTRITSPMRQLPPPAGSALAVPSDTNMRALGHPAFPPCTSDEPTERLFCEAEQTARGRGPLIIGALPEVPKIIGKEILLPIALGQLCGMVFGPLLGPLNGWAFCEALLTTWGSPKPLWEDSSEAPVDVVGSMDPNEKTGPRGSQSSRWIATGQGLVYTIFFENLATATAPAHEVVITDQLDPTKVDVGTLSLGPVSFGRREFVPSPGSGRLATEIDLRPATELVVRVRASFDPSSGVLRWRFAAVDATTGESPADPFAGFLPPNRMPPEGEGSVTFTIEPRRELATGDEIRNRASIVFDANAPIDTGEWRNTLDGAAPESQVEELGATQPSPRFEVRWSGVDEGAGIRDYTVFVSEDGGPYTPWLRHTSDTSAIFPGQEGRGYRFYSIASDQASNLEEAPGAPDAVTRTPESHGDSQPSDGGPPLGGGGPLLGGDGPFLGSRYSSADLRADLVSDLRSVARALRRLGVRRVQRRKVVRHRFTPLLAGTTAVTWNAQAQPPASRRPVVIARGRATAREAGPLTVRVRLTRAGRKLLRRSGRLRIALSATFRPEIGAAVSATARVAFLRRR